MLSKEDNELLCSVSPDTPMGQALRRFWVPAFQLGDVAVPDGPPIRVRALGENLVAFRDSSGQLGVLEEACCHRNASLVFGRVEEGGLRCIYHGWKYDTAGTILEMPNCATTELMGRLRQRSYPVREGGGLGWIYMGPKDKEPPFPALPWTTAPHVRVSELVYDCNWVQVQEGSIDSSHVGILHLDTLAVMRPGPRTVGSFHFDGVPWDDSIPQFRGAGGVLPDDNAPEIEIETQPFGFHYAAIRKMTDASKRHVRVTAMIMPYVAQIAGSAGAVIVVPRDDHSCSFIGVQPLDTPSVEQPQDRAAGKGAEGFDHDPTESRRLVLPPQDRQAMAARVSYAGFRGGNRIQDAAVQGVNAPEPVFSRANENLVPADAAIVRFRRSLVRMAELVQEGKDVPQPPADFDFSTVKVASQVIEADTSWLDLVDPRGAKERQAV